MFGKLTRWRSAIVKQPAADLTQESLASADLVWLPDPGRWSFRADPFGMWRGDRLYVFVERFDFTDPRGRIEVLTYDHNLQLLSAADALREPWHLSYPFVFEAEGATWMLPEASESGELTLYRAVEFPIKWKRELTIPAIRGAVDATPFYWNERWWLFYAVRQDGPDRRHELHIAYAKRIDGSWTRHPMNPVRVGLADCRPAGTPILTAAGFDLPVQDARKTYGGAVQRLRIGTLDERRFEAQTQSWLSPMARFAPFNDGLHTLASAGQVSLIDVKQIDRSPSARWYKTVGHRFDACSRPDGWQ